MLKRLYILATMVLLVALSLPMNAQTKRSKSRERALQESIAKRKKDIKAQEKELETLKKNKASTEELVISLTEQIESRNALIEETNEQIKELTAEVRASERRIRELSGQLLQLENNVGEIVRTAYRNYRNQSPITYIFSAKSFSEIARRISMLRIATSYRQSQIQEVTAVRKDVEEERRKLTKQREELNAVKKQLNTERKKLNEDVAAAKKSIERMSAKEKEVLKAKLENERLNKIEAKELTRLRALARGNKSGSSFAKGISYVKSASFAKGKLLTLPVANGVAAVYKGNMAEIVGKEGAAVTTIYDGKVLDIKRNKVTNKYDVFIAHGEYITTYSNLLDVAVKAGDIVKTNQRIGTIGAMFDLSTGQFKHKLIFGLISPAGMANVAVKYVFKR
jgi:peptidoglycan hydrolase CwlO-like protein